MSRLLLSLAIFLALATLAESGILLGLGTKYLLHYSVSKDPDDVKFYLYPNQGKPEHRQEIIYNDKESLTDSAFNFNTSTVFIVHGFTDNGTVHINEHVPKAYLASSLNYNYIVVDWGLLSGNNAVFNNDMQMGALYTTVVMNSLLRVAKRVSKFIQFLDLDPSSVHIVGHSLGAHLSGNVGRVYHIRTEKKLARITGLDPAGPLFSVSLTVPKIDKEHAEFVDVIYTNIGHLGEFGKLGSGHVSFIPNGGVVQPGCEVDDTSCSHQYAARLFAASISKDFPACKCVAEDETLLEGEDLDKCLDNCPSETVLLGENCPATARGLYSLKTSATP